MLALTGIGLADVFRMRAQAQETARTSEDTSVIFLWLPGGVTHHESFDPKPDAPAEVRGEIRPIATNVPGVHVAEVLPCLARHMDKAVIIRSLVGATGGHDAFQRGVAHFVDAGLNRKHAGQQALHVLEPAGFEFALEPHFSVLHVDLHDDGGVWAIEKRRK